MTAKRSNADFPDGLSEPLTACPRGRKNVANWPWLDEVVSRLSKRGLPPAYIRRFTEELSDHLEDVKEDIMSTEKDVVSRLGEPERVAEAAVAEYRQRSFLGQHSTAAFAVFAVSPVSLQIALFIIVVLAVKAFAIVAEQVGLLSDNGHFTAPSPLAVEITQYVFSFLFVVIPSVLAALLYCKLAQRLGLSKRWAIVSCLVLAAMALLPCWYVRLGADAAGHPCVVSGLSIPFLEYGWSLCWLNISQLLQLAAPLAIGWWLLRRRRHVGETATGAIATV
jgi:hypothetical protein